MFASRDAAPADAKNRKSAEWQVLATNTKTERREVSGCSAPVSQPTNNAMCR